MTSGRGGKRRSELIEAGFELLAEAGWAGVTQRAVAARANTNAGLVHYYFKGTPGLRQAVAEHACQWSIGGMVDQFLSAHDETALIAGLGQALAGIRAQPAHARLIAEVASAAFDQPEIGAAIRAELARARDRVQQWFTERHPTWSSERLRDTATTLTAAVDGLALHLVLDPALATVDLPEVLQCPTGGQEKQRQ